MCQLKGYTTAMDCIHPRWFPHSSDECVGCVILLWRWMFLVCDLSREQRNMLVRLLEKEVGGWRPTALFKTQCRVWSKAYSDPVKQWAHGL